MQLIAKALLDEAMNSLLAHGRYYFAAQLALRSLSTSGKSGRASSARRREVLERQGDSGLLELQMLDHLLADWDQNVAAAGTIVADEFRELHRSTVVVAWSVLDWLTADVVVEEVTAMKPAEWPEDLTRHKLPVSEVLGAPRDELVRRLLAIHDQGANGPRVLKDRLAMVGLEGKLPDGMERSLIELHATRNIVAHRNARVDSRFLDLCPWRRTDLTAGDELPLDQHVIEEFLSAAAGFVTEVNDWRRISEGKTPLVGKHFRLWPIVEAFGGDPWTGDEGDEPPA